MFYRNQTTAAQTAYASLSSAALLDNVRNIASVPGSFSLKNVKGKPYWYYQVPDLTGKQKQIFLGPATTELTALIEQHKNKPGDGQHMRDLARMAIHAGCAYLVPNHAKIITRLADAGFFRAGGILIGTHVYMGYQNLLGVKWASGAQTLDIDFAHPGRNISIALPSDVRMDTKDAIASLKMGFVPVQSLTTYVKSDEKDLQIDFVTTVHRGGDKPIKIESLNIEMQPLKFMEFAMESPIQMTMMANQGPIIVNTPPPEKYAVHKLLVYGERPPEMRVKAGKDLEQAACLIAYLSEHDPELLRASWRDLVSRGKGWQQRAVQGLEAVQARYPELDVAALKAVS